MAAIDQTQLTIPVLASGKGWLVVDKPSGMTVHNQSGHDLCSILKKDATMQADFRSDFGVNPVHRLDKETSGVLLLATTREMFRFFSEQFESHLVKKQYMAILHGSVETLQGESPWGIWRWALSKTAAGRLKPQGTGRLFPSETLYRILEHTAHYTLVEIELITGRTHQIRRHAVLSGHPVAGDERYGPKRAVNYLKKNLGFDRLGLHARSLTLQLPEEAGGAPITVETTAIPNQMLELLKNDTRP